MEPLSLDAICQITGATPAVTLPADAPRVTAVSTDSKQITPGCLFIALRGERFDAHQFVGDAARAGAAAALIEVKSRDVPAGFPLLRVTNTYTAMGALAAFLRGRLGGRVIAVAGSNGKTGTKLLIDAVLKTALLGSISPKSFNNNVGVPLAIFPADPSADYLVLELGTNHPGEITELTRIAQPDIAVITNAGAEHLEGLFDLPGVRRENASITRGMSAAGVLIVNGDDPDLVSAVADYSGRRVTFGFDAGNDLVATDVHCDEAGVQFRINHNDRAFVPLLGAHTACNALAAVAVGRELGLSLPQIIAGLSQATGPDMRLQLQRFGPVTVINDCYNANPSSMRTGLATLASLNIGKRRVAVLGDMLELGETRERYHHELGQLAGEMKLDLLACVGPESARTADSARSAGMGVDRVIHFGDSTAAAENVPRQLVPGDLVLLKASRGTHLEKVVEAISARFGSESVRP